MAAAVAVSCARGPRDPFVAGMAAALGGADVVEKTATLLLEGDGESYYLGENRAPDTDLPVFETRFRQAFDWSHGRFRKEELRLPTFLTGSAGLRRVISALDGPIGYDIGADERARRTTDEVTANRRAAILHHPLGLIRAAMSDGAMVRPLPPQGGLDRAEIATADGLVETVAIDRQTGLPVTIASAATDPLLGDVTAETTFEAYDRVGPLVLPTRITERLGGIATSRFHVTGQTLNVDPDAPLPPAVFRAFSATARLGAPPALASEPPPSAPPLAVEPVAPGVWRAGAGDYWSVLVAFSDHVALIEAPIDDARTEALLAEAKTLAPGKPVTQLVVTHHHFDHIGGVRAAVASGLTLFVRGGLEPHAEVTASRSSGSRDEATYLTDLLARPHTRAPDLLAKQPRAPSIAQVGHGAATIMSPARTLMLLPIEGSAYADTLLMAYLPKERLLIEADVVLATPARLPRRGLVSVRGESAREHPREEAGGRSDRPAARAGRADRGSGSGEPAAAATAHPSAVVRAISWRELSRRPRPAKPAPPWRPRPASKTAGRSSTGLPWNEYAMRAIASVSFTGFPRPTQLSPASSILSATGSGVPRGRVTVIVTPDAIDAGNSLRAASLK